MQGGGQQDPAPKRELLDILSDEFAAIAPRQQLDRVIGLNRSIETALNEASETAQNANPPPHNPTEAAAKARRQRLYQIAYGLDFNALCLSGGGIRSAAISLGVIQALVDKRLLNQFHYLSTVSGGGYIGSWLSAWLHHTDNAEEVLARLGSDRNNSDQETPPLEHLREYSNYLTPKVGVFSADTWTALSIVLRNIAVNWLILVPALALLVIGVKLLALFVSWEADPLRLGWSNCQRALIALVSLACMIAGAMAFGYKLGRLYIPPYGEPRTAAEKARAAADPAGEPERVPKGSPAALETPSQAQRRFLLWSLALVIVAGFCFVWLASQGTTPAIGLLQWAGVNWAGSSKLLAVLLFAGLVYGGAIVAAGVWRRRLGVPAVPRGNVLGLLRDLVCWVGGVLVFAVLGWLGSIVIQSLPPQIPLYTHLVCDVAASVCPQDSSHTEPVILRRESLMVVFGMPWFLIATMYAHFTYLLLCNKSSKGEVEREWLGRASGWHFIAALAWVMLSAVVLLGTAIFYNAKTTLDLLIAGSGAVNWVLGKSSATPAKGAATDWKGIAANIALAVSGPLFAALLLILLAMVIDWSVLGGGGQCFATDEAWDYRCRTWWWILPSGISIALLLAANLIININAFSLHAVYRNRLIRCFLGGARKPHRHPEGFTDFDWDDDLRVAALWKRTDPPTVPTGRDWRPFHVINMTLNLAATNRLAWQERKAMPFSVTPFACGNADLGYRETSRYGGRYIEPVPKGEIKSGISLGTAMAISGAAVSSNMGYHSSMSLSFLLTFFNVRLGVWLGNPGNAGGHRLAPMLRRPYETTGPQFAVRPLNSELFGLTDDHSPYVNLSDGGHFEDLGLYEMVRRRCRRIIVVDGDQDRDRGFDDLGNAVRKIWIDLGVRITFDDSGLLAAEQDAKLAGIPYFALGTIEYVSDPKLGKPLKTPTGKILYIKPVVRGDEPAADVIAYKRAHDDFPAQSTAEQWFDESQFEAYRRLGQLMTERIIDATGIERGNLNLTTLFEGLDKIDGATMKKHKPPVNIC
jgi:hypothetical protein